MAASNTSNSTKWDCTSMKPFLEYNNLDDNYGKDF